MTIQDIASAVRRVESVLQRRPEFAIADDAPALARWDGGLRVNTRYGDGVQVTTDMPRELGGTGDQVTPGWLLRAGLAACAVTSITLAAATRGVALTALQVQAVSRSDARGLLGVPLPDGAAVHAGPFDVQLLVNIAADGADAQQLRTLVQDCLRHSPVPVALTQPTPLALQITVGSA